MRSLVYLSFLALPALVRADQHALPEAAAALAELKAVYQASPGFIATYTSEADDKRLTGVIARDLLSGLTVLEVTAQRGEQSFSSRHWKTLSGDFFILAGGKLLSVQGVQPEMDLLAQLFKSLELEAGGLSPNVAIFSPHLFLNEEGFASGLGTGLPWLDTGDTDLTVVASDPDSVTFRSKTSGELQVSRKTGLLIEQKHMRENGETRVLKLTEHKPNPGAASLEALIKDWPVGGGTRLSSAEFLRSFRLDAVGLLTEGVTKGHADLGKLVKCLEEQRPLLFKMMAGSVVEGEGKVSTLPVWKEVFSRDRLRQLWLRTKPADENDDEAFDRFLSQDSISGLYQKTFAEQFSKQEPVRELVLFELFGRNAWENLDAGNEAGEAAKAAFADAYILGYLEALAKAKWTKHLTERTGLD